MFYSKFLKSRLAGFKYAFKGAIILFKKEESIQVQSFISIAVLAAGFYFDITPTEWMMQLLAIGMVLSTEAINTAIEETANFIHPDFHNKIGLIKDIAAGAVLFAAIIALLIAAIIYIPHIKSLF